MAVDSQGMLMDLSFHFCKNSNNNDNQRYNYTDQYQQYDGIGNIE